MRTTMLLAVVLLLLSGIPLMANQSLLECYNEAEGNGEYDKYIELDPAIEYYGDLSMYNCGNICIIGNGARIYADPDDANPILITFAATHLDIQNCVFIGGIGSIYMTANASGEIKNCTMVGTTNAAIRTYVIGSSNQVYIYDNIIVDCYDGLICNEYERPSYIGYNTVYDCTRYRYAEYCEG